MLRCRFIPVICFRQIQKDSSKGVALIVVLWISAILSSIVLAGAYIAKLELRKAAYALREVQALNIAYSGIVTVENNLLQDGNGFDCLGEKWKSDDGGYNNAAFGDGVLNVSVEDEESKVNINSIPLSVLVKLPPVALAPNISELSDSLKDWVDADSAMSRNGAEDGYYMSLKRPYHCKNRPIDALDELYLIKGFSDKQLVAELMKFVTAYSDALINVNTSPMDVLKALPGIDNRTAESIVAHRSGNDLLEGTGDDEPFKSVEEIRSVAGDEVFNRINGLVTVNSSFFRVSSAGKIGKVVKRVEAMLERRAGAVKIIFWREL